MRNDGLQGAGLYSRRPRQGGEPQALGHFGDRDGSPGPRHEGVGGLHLRPRRLLRLWASEQNGWCYDTGGISPTIWAGFGRAYLATLAFRGGLLAIQTRNGEAEDIQGRAGERSEEERDLQVEGGRLVRAVQGGGMPMAEWMTSSSLGVCRVLTRVNVTYLKIIVWRER